VTKGDPLHDLQLRLRSRHGLIVIDTAEDERAETLVSAMYTAFAGDHALTGDMLTAEIASTRPLSQTMAERVEAIREWAAERTVRAN